MESRHSAVVSKVRKESEGSRLRPSDHEYASRRYLSRLFDELALRGVDRSLHLAKSTTNEREAGFCEVEVGIPVKLNAHSEGKLNGIPG